MDPSDTAPGCGNGTLAGETPARETSPPTRGPRRPWAVRLAALLLVPVALILLDRILGLAVPSLGSTLLSTAGAAARYRTLEFDITAHSNSLGLRGARIDPKRSAGVQRVLAVGDSFTWGWGVADEAAWPAVLERLLKAHGLQVEIANAGQPGADPVVYAENARRILPVLKPDLVVVGVVQGEDIEQLRSPVPQNSWSQASRRAFRTLVPNTLGLIKRLRTALKPVVEVGPSWRLQAQSILRRLSEAERGRYAALDPEVRGAFEGGRLNPFLVGLALRQPDCFLDATRGTELEAPQAIMAGSLRDVAKVAAANACGMIVVSIPYPLYVSRAGLATQRRIGFEVDDHLPGSDVPDRTVQEACRRAGVPCLGISDSFRQRSADEQLFFPLDGHLNEAGHRLLAEQLAPAVETRLRGDHQAHFPTGFRLAARATSTAAGLRPLNRAGTPHGCLSERRAGSSGPTKRGGGASTRSR